MRALLLDVVGVTPREHEKWTPGVGHVPVSEIQQLCREAGGWLPRDAWPWQRLLPCAYSCSPAVAPSWTQCCHLLDWSAPPETQLRK